MDIAKSNTIRKSKDGILFVVLHCLQTEIALHQIDGFYDQIDFYSCGSIPLKHSASCSVYEIMRALNQAIEEVDVDDLRKCKAFTLHVDESTDQYTSHKLVVYVHYAGESFEKKEKFCKLIELEELDATSITDKIATYFLENGINILKMVMFTFDGAAVMLGKRRGVAAQLRDRYGITHLIAFHCVCHREALAMTDAAKACPPFQEMQTAIASLIRFISQNANLMGMQRLSEAFETVYVKLQQVFEIRWHSIARSVKSVCRSYHTILLQLKHAAASGDQHSAEAKGHLKRCKNEEFITKLFNLNDILQILDRLCLKFQSDDIHPFDSNRYTEDTINELNRKYLQYEERIVMPKETINAISKYVPDHERLKTVRRCRRGVQAIKELVTTLVEVLERRLSDNSLVLNAVKVFQFTADEDNIDHYAEYGNDDINTLFVHFQQLFDGVTYNEVYVEWDRFKNGSDDMIKANKKEYNWRRTLELLLSHRDDYPILANLGAIVMAFTSQNATAERGFSLSNRLRTKLRNRLTVKTTDTLRRLKLLKTQSIKSDYTRAAELWHASKNRYAVGKKFKKGKKKDVVAVAAAAEPGPVSGEKEFVCFDGEESMRSELTNFVKYGW